LRARGGVEKCLQLSGEYFFFIAESQFSFGAVVCGLALKLSGKRTKEKWRRPTRETLKGSSL